MTKNELIGLRIKDRREQLGLTQEKLGKRLFLNKSTIQRYETGKIQTIKIPFLYAMAKALKVNPEWLALKTDNPSLHSQESISSRFDRLLIFKEISFSDIAKLLHIDEQELEDYIYDSPDSFFKENDSLLLEICNALNVKIDYFFNYDVTSNDSYNNYIGFLLSKVDMEMQLTNVESSVLCAYLNDENINIVFPQGILLPPDEEEAAHLYRQLDRDDRGEIRGEMKHMLKAEKYKEKDHASTA